MITIEELKEDPQFKQIFPNWLSETFTNDGAFDNGNQYGIGNIISYFTSKGWVVSEITALPLKNVIGVTYYIKIIVEGKTMLFNYTVKCNV